MLYGLLILVLNLYVYCYLKIRRRRETKEKHEKYKQTHTHHQHQMVGGTVEQNGKRENGKTVWEEKQLNKEELTQNENNVLLFSSLCIVFSTINKLYLNIWPLWWIVLNYFWKITIYVLWSESAIYIISRLLRWVSRSVPGLLETVDRLHLSTRTPGVQVLRST